MFPSKNLSTGDKVPVFAGSPAPKEGAVVVAAAGRCRKRITSPSASRHDRNHDCTTVVRRTLEVYGLGPAI